MFRKFENKKDIVLHGVSQEKWRANVTPELFQNVQWELEPDLEMFMTAYNEYLSIKRPLLAIACMRSDLKYDKNQNGRTWTISLKKAFIGLPPTNAFSP